MATTPNLTDEQRASGWIAHDGSECPLPADAVVTVQCRDGYIDVDSASQFQGWWRHVPSWYEKPVFGFHHADIVAYRPEPTQ